jgi:hypothetical protein
MQIDNDKHQEKTGKNDPAGHAAATGQDVHEPGASGSRIAKLLVWPQPKSPQSNTLAEETRHRGNKPKGDELDVEYVQGVSQWKRSGFKRRLIRIFLLVMVLTSAVLTGYFAAVSLYGFDLKGVWNRLSSLSTTSTSANPVGQVTGIIHSDDKPSAVIGNSLVHEGDSLYGVRIAKIHFNTVEFERDGQTWSQRLREKPSKYWPKLPQDGTRQ